MVRRLALLCFFASALCSAAPVALPDTVRMHRGQKARINVRANDTDAAAPATVEITKPPQFGTATVDPEGRILYAHTSGQPATDALQYRLAGPGGNSAATDVTVTFAETLRVAPSGFALPGQPPATAYQVQPAFGGLTFDLPTAIASPPGDTRRLFVCELLGKIRLIPDVTAAAPVKHVFLDLAQVLAARTGETIGPGEFYECGLLGLAFHPEHAQNGFFFVFYTVTKGGQEYQRLSRFAVHAADPNTADPASELILLEQVDRVANHNGGDLHFGPDGYLYFCAGDEGDQFDPLQNSQRIDLNFFSGMFRIDVDKRPGNLEPHAHPGIPLDNGVARYSVPADNPFVGATTYGGLPVDPAKVRTEFWATGLRSPWRFSFDSATGDLWLGDVGQYDYEEINVITRGGNYGWTHRNGKHPGFRAAPPGFSAEYIDPVIEYLHVEFGGDLNYRGNSIIGGVVYRGTRLGSLHGAYICGDWLSGNIWAARRPETGPAQMERIAGLSRVAAFGVDPSNDDVLLVQYNYGTTPLHRLSGAAVADSFPSTLSAAGLFADVSDLSPNPGLLPYEPNLAFWSDHAVKQRWFAVPDGEALGWARDATWTFPEGMLWVKHFDLETERGNPATKQRIETRVLVKNAGGVYGVSYRWNEEQTDALLVPEEGAVFDISISENGVPRNQRWQIPSRADCTACHNAAAGHALSFDTRQLNRVATMNGFAGNQIDLLRGAGFFSNAPEPVNVLPRHARPDETGFSVEARVRSYLAVNCGYCHRPGGGAPPTWDGRAHRSLAETLLIEGNAVNDGGNNINKLVVPGQTAASIVLSRVAAANGFSRMPPLGTSELDSGAIDLLTQWIASDLPARETFESWRQARFGAAPAGAPEFDADDDGQSNENEFLLGSDPKDSASAGAPQLIRGEGNITLQLTVPANRGVQIECSSDLLGWTLWDAPGNDGIPRRAGALSLTGPAMDTKQFFRVRAWEP